MLRLQLPWFNSPEYAGFVVPNSGVASSPGMPTYSQESLCVQIREGGPAFDPLKELKDDRVDMALAEAAYVAKQIGSGENYTVIASFYQTSSLALVGLPGAPGTGGPTLQDFLSGKRIGKMSQGYDLMLELMLKNANVGYQYLTFVNEGIGPMGLKGLKDGTMDFATATIYRDLGEVLQYLNPQTHFLYQQQELAIYETSSYNAPAIHNVLVIKNSKLPSIRSDVIKFLKVVSKAWLFCRDNEGTCLNAYPYYGPLEERLMRETLRQVFPSSALGVVPLASWTSLESSLIAAALITNRSSYTSKVDNSVIQEALLTVTTSALTAFAPENLNLCAPYGSTAPLRKCIGFEHTACSAGYEPISNTSCTKCDVGKFSANALTIGQTSRMNTCVKCAPGSFTSLSGTSQCTFCTKGRFRNNNVLEYTSGGTASDFESGVICGTCDKGRAATSSGMSACALCDLGRFATNVAAVECANCADGTYASNHGATLCSSCPDSTSTRGQGAKFVYDCACAAGLYRATDQLCKACPVGFTCPAGSDEVVLKSFASGYVSGQYPHLLPGHWTSRNDPLSVYLCKDAVSCPGGPPETCGPHMGERACSLCESGYFRQGEKCEQCTTTDETWFNYPAVPAVLGTLLAVGAYALLWDGIDQWGSVLNEMWALLFLVIVHLQILGVIIGSSVPWPSKIKGTLYAWEFFVDIPDMLRLSCVNNSQFRLWRDSYTIKVTAHFFMMGCFGVVYAIGFFLAALGALVRKTRQRWLDDMFKCLNMKRFTGIVPPARAVEPTALINAFLAIFFAFFITFAFISFQLFMCYEHPNGKLTMRFSPDVECASIVWQGMIAVGLSMLVPCCGLVVALLAVVAVAPVQFHKKSFRTCFKFLLIKWRPDVWWFGPIVIIRSLLLCLTHLISQEGERQLLWQLAILICYGGFAAVFRPWRYWSANVLDSVVCATLALFVAFSLNFVSRSTWLDKNVSIFTAVFSFLPAALYGLAVIWILIRVLGKSYFNSLTKDSSDNMQKALAKFSGSDIKAAEELVSKLAEHDLEAFRRVTFMLKIELMQDPGQAKAFQWIARGNSVDQFPTEARQEDTDVLDTGDLGSDGSVQDSKWGKSPPNRIDGPISASLGGAATPKIKDPTTPRTDVRSVTPPPPNSSPNPPKI